MIYIQFPIDDTSLISKSAEIFTRDSSAGRCLARTSEQKDERCREGCWMRIKSQGIWAKPSWIIIELGDHTESQARCGEENGTQRISSCSQ